MVIGENCSGVVAVVVDGGGRALIVVGGGERVSEIVDGWSVVDGVVGGVKTGAPGLKDMLGADVGEALALMGECKLRVGSTHGSGVEVWGDCGGGGCCFCSGLVLNIRASWLRRCSFAMIGDSGECCCGRRCLRAKRLRCASLNF